jgi:hypothetical protein
VCNFENCTFDSSVAKGESGRGGGLHVIIPSKGSFSGSYLIFKNCTVSGTNGKGGGIYFNIEANTFTDFYMNVFFFIFYFFIFIII